MRTNHQTARVALGIAAALLCGGAVAGTPLPGGVNVMYTIETGLGLFGSAEVVGDKLVLSPTPIAGSDQTGFLATGATMYAKDTLTITIAARSGYQLTGFEWAESGDYTLDGGSAWVAGYLDAFDSEADTGIGGGGNAPIPASLSVLSFAGNAGAWSDSAAIALPATGWGGANGIVEEIRLTLSNQLFATGPAEIWKDVVSITTVATPVPEADTYLMLLAGLGLVGFAARRRLSAAA